MPENGVPIVLDRVVRATQYHVTNFSPAILSAPLEDEENPALFKAPCSFLKKRVQLIIPALAALLARPFWNGLGNKFPLARADLSNKLDKQAIRLAVPGPFLSFLVVFFNHLIFFLEVYYRFLSVNLITFRMNLHLQINSNLMLINIQIQIPVHNKYNDK